MHRVYISASTQRENVGVGAYGTEQDRMMLLADKVSELLKKQGIEVFRNGMDWTLEQTVKDCNALECELFIDNHSNAGVSTAEGTEVYYYGNGGTSSNSFKLATLLYDEVAKVSVGKDRGLHPDTDLYANGLYVIQNTKPPACLIEHMFHTNSNDVNDFLTNFDKFAEAEAKAVCSYLGIKYFPQVADNIYRDKIERILRIIQE